MPRKKTSESQMACEKASPILLPVVLDLMAAPSLRETLMTRMEALSGDKPCLVLDGRDVDRISTPCVQVLVAADLSLKDRGGSLAVAVVSDAFKQAMTRLGLDQTLTAWEARNG